MRHSRYDYPRMMPKSTSAWKTVSNTALYSLSSVFQRGSSIIFFPIFSLYLDKQDYGILSVTASIYGFLSSLGTLELLRTVPRFVHDDEEGEGGPAALLGTLFTSVILVSSVTTVLYVVVGARLSHSYLNEIPFFPFMAYTVYALPFLCVYNLYTTFLRATHQGWRFFIVDMSFFASNVGLNLLFVIVFHMKVLGLIVSTLVSAVLFAAYAYWIYFRHTPIRIERPRLRALLAYSLPLVPYILMGTALEGIDRLLLNVRVGAEVVGLYAIGTAIAAVFSTFKESAYAAFAPWFFESCGRTDDAYVNRVMEGLCLAMGAAAIGVSWFSPEVLSLLSSNPALVPAWRFTPLLVGGLYAVFLGEVLGLVVFHTKIRVRWLPLATVIGCVVDVTLCLVLIGRFGAFGAAFAKVMGFTALSAVIGWIGYRASPFRFRYRFLLLITATTLALSLLPYLPFAGPWFTVVKVFAYAALLAASARYLNTQFALYVRVAGLWADVVASSRRMLMSRR